MFNFSPRALLLGAGGLVLSGLALLLLGGKGAKPATKMSPGAVAKLRSAEKLMTHLYNDPAGHATVGVGHLIHLGNANGSEPPGFLKGGLPAPGNNTRAPSPTLSVAEAETLFKTDIAKRERYVVSQLQVPVSQPQFDAVMSFIYNAGEYRAPLYAAINRGDFEAAATYIANGPTAGGLAGVITRRAEEAALFRSGPVLA
jgi:lysozyme